MSSVTEDISFQISNFGKFFLKAYDESVSIQIKCKNVLICGMGGSAIAGNYLESISNLSKSKNQVLVWRNYDIPSFLNKDWIAIVISYSGNTEESLSMLSQLLEIDLGIHIISSGGKLEGFARSNNLNFAKIPSGYQPRFALPLILGTTYKLVETVLNLDSISDDLRDGINSFDNLESIVKLKHIVNSMLSKIPIIISDFEYAALSIRFRCQLNENSKMMAHNYVLPEFSHNAIVGLENLTHANYCLVIINRGILEHHRTKLQRNFIESYAKRKKIDVYSLESNYDRPLIQLLDITRQLDYVSYNVALSTNVDPITVKSIDELKQNLNEN